MGENQGTCEETGMQHGRIPRYMGSGMYEKCGSELESPYLPPKKVKLKCISLAKSLSWQEGEHSIYDDCVGKRSSGRHVITKVIMWWMRTSKSSFITLIRIS